MCRGNAHLVDAYQVYQTRVRTLIPKSLRNRMAGKHQRCHKLFLPVSQCSQCRCNPSTPDPSVAPPGKSPDIGFPACASVFRCRHSKRRPVPNVKPILQYRRRGCFQKRWRPVGAISRFRLSLTMHRLCTWAESADALPPVLYHKCALLSAFQITD